METSHMSFAYSYAFALKDSDFTEKQDFVALVESLNQLDQSFQEPDINLFFLSPAISFQAKKQVLKTVLEAMGLGGLIGSFLYLLLDKKKWSQWPAILKHLNNMKEEQKSFVWAEVESALPLSEELKVELGQKLEQFLGKPVRFKETTNSHLIGGIKVRAGGFVFDDSLSYHLKRLESEVQTG